MVETEEQLQKELDKSIKWEKSQSDLWFWEKIGRLPFKLLDKLTPTVIQTKIGTLIDELGQYIQTGGKYLSTTDSLKSYYKAHAITTLEEVKALPIVEMDQAVDKLSNNRKKIATVQGAGTGIGGIFTLSIDIPLLLGIQLKTLQDIAMCYGYNPNDKEERIFIVKVLQFVSADIHGKQAIVKQLSMMDSADEQVKREIISELQGWREVVMTHRDQLGWKKLFQMIPIVGLFVGALINRSSVNDLAEAGMMLYRKRRIQERLQTLAND